jgi:isocitrate lyase
VINRFLEVADRVQALDMKDKLTKIASLPLEKQADSKAKLINAKVDYLTQPILADLEQGWGDPKKVFLSGKYRYHVKLLLLLSTSSFHS